jgi:hypothetical protein
MYTFLSLADDISPLMLQIKPCHWGILGLEHADTRYPWIAARPGDYKGKVLWKKTTKTEAQCHSGCDMINIPPCSKALRALNTSLSSLKSLT